MCLFFLDFKNILLQEMPSASVIISWCRQSWPLAVISSPICANASWQLARHDAVWPGPRLALQAIAAFTGWRSSTCCTATAALSALYKDLSIRPRLPWRRRLRLSSCQAGGSALPHPWVSGVKEREGLRGRLVRERSSSSQVIRQENTRYSITVIITSSYYQRHHDPV